MLSFLCRVFIDSWVGRIIAGLFFLAFIGWGAVSYTHLTLPTILLV